MRERVLHFSFLISVHDEKGGFMSDLNCLLAGLIRLFSPLLFLVLWHRKTGARFYPALIAFPVCFPVFIAGATTTGALVASATLLSRSSAIPFAIFAMTFAVAGATTSASAASASDMCPGFHSSGSENMSHCTGLRLSVRNVRGVTNSLA